MRSVFRIIAGVGVIALAVGTTVSCGGGKKAEAKSTEPKEIQLWHYFSDAELGIFHQVVLDYNASQDRVKVVDTYVPREELLKQYTMGAVSGELPDLGMVDNPDMASFIKMGVFLDITDRVNAWGQKDQYYEGPLASCTWEGKIYGLPENSNCIAFFYDTDAFAKAGITKAPSTWDELTADCAALKKTFPDAYPTAICAIKTEEGTFQFIPWLLSAGGNVENLGSPECVSALSYLTGLINSGYMPKDVINWTQNDIMNQFVAGKVLSMVNGPWNVVNIKNQAPDKNWTVALIPKDKKNASVLGGENFGIMKGADVDASWDFLKYLCGKEVSADQNAKRGKFSPRKDSMASKSVWTEDPIMSVFAQQLGSAMPRGPHPRWPEISDAMSTAMHEAFTGAKSPEQAMMGADAKVRNILSE